MEAPTLAEMGDLCLPCSSSAEGETVCDALARFENTLCDAIKEIHEDISAFKLGIERRVEETATLCGPLGRAVAQLQQENQQLRSQMEALTRQVELLSEMTYDRSTLLNNSLNHKNHLSDIQENHQGSREVIHGKSEAHTQSQAPLHIQPCSLGSLSTQSSPASPPETFSTSPSSSSPPVGSRISSVVTGPVLSSSPSTGRFSSRATFAVSSKTNSIEREEPIEVDTVLTHPALANRHSASTGSSSWTPSPVRALSSPHCQENVSSAPAKSVTYSGLLQHDSRDADICSGRSLGQVGERRRELVRSQTLPRNIGAQARRSVFERLESEASSSRPKPVDCKPKLKRSQSFGVSSASSIKQILLEWCRSKTIGYQNIDLQNFSSSWSDGMAFCALVHSFFPTEFDYTALSPTNCKQNFELAFGTAEVKAGCDRLIEVDDMMIMGHKPDPMCVFTYVQSLYNHLRKFE
ncbi:smoothelin, like isoform X2 [Halichoeres trimaculatus]|uniref:smoothelin, like isoform X2 n=1 Tax=Halichoeres trimaculatus TaxID=147232 RepID=UPI003D9F0553